MTHLASFQHIQKSSSRNWDSRGSGRFITHARRLDTVKACHSKLSAFCLLASTFLMKHTLHFVSQDSLAML
ncbi:hypothetical protein BJY01DRAFT_221114 [Aspergillus pseudoustus]|uniref:Uncharacterized protein n=1 Tax=Aspergillus pseudoustus TaxID=1810923 RepID=A0ABR4JB90_9EURO